MYVTDCTAFKALYVQFLYPQAIHIKVPDCVIFSPQK